MIDDQGFHDSETIYIAAFYGVNERKCGGGHTQGEQKVNFGYPRKTHRMMDTSLLSVP
jgi:hypothetical protein